MGELYAETKQKISCYLKTGKSGNFNGAEMLMWSAQTEFHKNHSALTNFIKQIFTKEFCNVDTHLYDNLIRFQHEYQTDPYKKYPIESSFSYNFYNYINNIDNELIKDDYQYTFDLLEPIQGGEYFDRLYYRRRQGWGKSKITQVLQHCNIT